MTRFSLSQQIEEIDRELAQRAAVYPRLVARGKLRQSVADFQVARLAAARATLAWMAAHEATLRQAVEAAARARAAELERLRAQQGDSFTAEHARQLASDGKF